MYQRTIITWNSGEIYELVLSIWKGKFKQSEEKNLGLVDYFQAIDTVK